MELKGYAMVYEEFEDHDCYVGYFHIDIENDVTTFIRNMVTVFEGNFVVDIVPQSKFDEYEALLVEDNLLELDEYGFEEASIG